MKTPYIRCLVALTATLPVVSMGFANPAPVSTDVQTTYPISNIVVIFQENISFDHYFGTYPYALNLPGENNFTAKRGTPTVNGLNQALLTSNLNEFLPNRLSPAQAATTDQDHEYMAEQQAFDHGLMDQFVQFTGASSSVVMAYFDGNTVTALWNYAQNFS